MTDEQAIKQMQFLVDAYTELQSRDIPDVKVGNIIKACRMSIKALGEQKAKGHWIKCEDDDYVQCSECFESFLREETGHYCIHCGAQMRGVRKK